MTHLRLRTQLFIATLLIISGLAGSLLFIIRRTVGIETNRQVQDGTEASVRAFESVQRQREFQLSRTAAMLADLPTLKALMTTQDALTIQDGSAAFWKLAGSDLFVLAKHDSEVVALHISKPGWSAANAQHDLRRSVEQGEDASWWYDDGRLYWVFVRPITAGSGSASEELGLLAVGYQIDSTVAQQLAVVAGYQIVLATRDNVIASTLPTSAEAELRRIISREDISTDFNSREIALGGNDYAFSSVLLHGSLPSPVRCFVLMPLLPVNSFINHLNHTIYFVGITAVLVGALLFGFVSRTITRPLENLVAGVRALAAGDFAYSIIPKGSSEVVELSEAFAKMREELLTSQEQRSEAERIAALGRAASSISHDLRHYLAAVVANAEFLCEAENMKLTKTEIYQEIITASNQMTDLIDSMRELAHQGISLSPEPSSLDQILRRAIDAVRVRPDFRTCKIALAIEQEGEGIFDRKKLERAFINLVLNACESTSGRESNIRIDVRVKEELFEIRVADNGPGIPEDIRGTLFDPFVSFGKPNGTGLGLAIVSKIIHDHGGSTSIETTSRAGTTVLVTLPRSPRPVGASVKSAIY
ncbi:MAG TPA: ATP-binding protein [Candidatus Acidoferrum sp.]|nr:ATP-binding protein [Candidatus Acidoferrum sp.]